jgi:hypothetical protein
LKYARSSRFVYTALDVDHPGTIVGQPDTDCLALVDLNGPLAIQGDGANFWIQGDLSTNVQQPVFSDVNLGYQTGGNGG